MIHQYSQQDTEIYCTDGKSVQYYLRNGKPIEASCQYKGRLKIQFYRPSGGERDRCPYAKRFTCTATRSSGMLKKYS